MSSDPPPAWLASVTRSFDDNPELQLAARQELSEGAAHATADQLDVIGEGFDRIDRPPPRKRTLPSWLPIAFAVLATLMAALLILLPYLDVRKLTKVMSAYGPDPHFHAGTLQSKMSPENHFAVFGDTTMDTEELAIRALWQTDPSNPVLFNYYLEHCDPYPDDLLDTAAAIDPDNGWFLLIAAGEIGADAVKRNQRPWSGPREDRPMAADWDILDSAKHQQALALVLEAVDKPRIDPYDTTHLASRLILLPPERDLVSRTARLIHVASSPSRGTFKLMNSNKILNAQIYALSQAGDTEALRALVPVIQRFCRELNRHDGLLVHQLVIHAICRGTYEHLLEACERNHMTAEAGLLRPVVLQLRAAKKEQDARRHTGTDLVRKHAGTLTGLSSAPFERFGSPLPSHEEMTPGRLVDYALVDRISLSAATLMLFLGLVGILAGRKLQPRLTARLGKRFSLLLDRRDWLLVFALGTLLPLAWLLVITRFTPLGGRNWNVTFFLFQPFSTQYAITLVLIIAATVSTVRWRLGQHAGVLGLGTRHPLHSLIPIALMALAIPLAGFIATTISMVPLVIAGILAGGSALWLLFVEWRPFFARRHNTLNRSAILAGLPRALAHTIILLAALMPLTILAERHWIARDALGRTSPENQGTGRLEVEATRALQATLQSALDAQP